MRLPARAITGHLVWGRDGSVWAVYRVETIPYSYAPRREKLAAHAQLRGALMALPPESRLLSICRPVDPGTIAERMLEGVELAAHPAWARMVENWLDFLMQVENYERRNYLAIKLPDTGNGWRGALGAAVTTLTESLVPPGPIVNRDLQARVRQAAGFEARISASLRIERVSAGELRWLYARALRRGATEPYLDDSWETTERLLGEGGRAKVATPALATLGEVIVKEGGFASDPGRPHHRRYLRIDTGEGIGYQTFMVVAEMPREFSFPGGGGEWFDHLKAFAFPVDWCVCLSAVPNQIAQAKARKQHRELTHQVGEYDGEPSGPPSSLADATIGVDHERSELSSNPSVPELQATIVFSVAADDLELLEARAGQVQSVFQPNEYAVPRPTGGQAQLCAATMPGSPQPPVARDYTQYLLPRDLAAGMPFTGAALGDPQGMLLGYTLDGGTFQPVLFDPAWGPANNRSGSLGIFGALGYGKSQTAKLVAYGALARGYQLVIVDRTVMGEYVRFSQVTPGTSQVVRVDAASRALLDPMRVFRGAERTRHTTGFLTMLTGTSPTELDGMELARAVRTAAADPDAGLDAVLDALASRRGDAHANLLLRKLEGFAEGELSHLVFGDGDLLRLNADCIVFHTPSLALPSRQQLASEHLARRLLPEQVFGQAMLYLVAAVSRSVIFANRDRFGAQLLDEASFLVASPQGLDLVLEGIRDGRKHNAALWILSQHPNDLIDDRLGDLLGMKMVFRQPRGAAAAALRFLEMDPEDRESQELLATGISTGQAFRHATSAYLDLVAISLAGGAAAEEALHNALADGQGWAFERLRGALRDARLRGVPPWEELGRLGHQLDVRELTELAGSLSLAGTEGATVRRSLMDKVVSSRAHQLSEAETRAATATDHMVVPLVVLLLGFILFILYPALVRAVAGL